MPTVLRRGPYRVYFFSHEGREPVHVHVDRDERTAKFWLGPVVLARNGGFGGKELRTIRGILETREDELVEAWNAYFGA